MALVEIGRFYNAVDAELSRLRLEADGITAFVFDSAMSFQGLATPARLMVDDEDEARARRLLEASED